MHCIFIHTRLLVALGWGGRKWEKIELLHLAIKIKVISLVTPFLHLHRDMVATVELFTSSHFSNSFSMLSLCITSTPAAPCISCFIEIYPNTEGRKRLWKGHQRWRFIKGFPTRYKPRNFSLGGVKSLLFRVLLVC